MTDWQVLVAPASLLIGFVAVATFLRSGLNRIEDKMDARFDKVDARFDKVDARFDRLEEIMRGHGERILAPELAVGISRAQMMQGPTAQGQLATKPESGS